MKFLPVLVAAFSTTAAAKALWNPGQVTFGSPPPTGDPVPGSSPLTFCPGSPEDNIFRIDYIDISPNPPLPGKPLTIKASGLLTKTIEDGAYVILDVKYGYIKLLHETLDLCENAGQVDMKCPVEKGEIIITKEVELPKAIPPGKYRVSANALTVDDEQITCLQAEIIFKPQTGF